MKYLLAPLVFSCAALHEVFCVGFVYFSERQNAKMTGVVTLCAGTVTVVGWMSALSNNAYLPFLVAGWGFGGYLGVKISLALTKKKEK